MKAQMSKYRVVSKEGKEFYVEAHALDRDGDVVILRDESRKSIGYLKVTEILVIHKDD